jgi:hypothetical protein
MSRNSHDDTVLEVIAIDHYYPGAAVDATATRAVAPGGHASMRQSNAGRRSSKSPADASAGGESSVVR